jgi:hypothetical protein
MMMALLGSMLLGIGTLSFMTSWNSSDSTLASEFEREQALNVATSGVNAAVSKLRLDRTWRTGYTNLPIANGLCTLTLTDIGMDSVRIRSEGSYGRARHVSLVRAKLYSIFPVVESALTVYGDSVSFSNSGKSFDIDGHDYLADGSTLGTNPAVYGMGVYNTKIDDYLSKALRDAGVDANVRGKDSVPSVGLFTNKDMIAELRTMYKNLATINLSAGKYSGNVTLGTLTAPEIVYIPGNLEWTGTIAGAGILVVDGDLIMKGTITWKGIVIAYSADIDIYLGGSGTPNLLGTTFIGTAAAGNITKIKINGDPYIRYSYSVLQTILSKLNLMQVEILSWYE